RYLYSFPTRRSSDLENPGRSFHHTLLPVFLCKTATKSPHAELAKQFAGVFDLIEDPEHVADVRADVARDVGVVAEVVRDVLPDRSEEHTSELQSREN